VPDSALSRVFGGELEGIVDNFDLRAIGRGGDGDHIEPGFGADLTGGLEVVQRRHRNLALFGGGDGQLGGAVAGALSGLDLDEGDRLPIPRDDVDFPDAGPVVPGDDFVAALFQPPQREGFGVPAEFLLSVEHPVSLPVFGQQFTA